MTIEQEKEQETKKHYEDRLAEEVLMQCCRDIPMDVVNHLMSIYRWHGIAPALEAAIAVVKLHTMYQ